MTWLDSHVYILQVQLDPMKIEVSFLDANPRLGIQSFMVLSQENSSTRWRECPSSPWFAAQSRFLFQRLCASFAAPQQFFLLATSICVLPLLQSAPTIIYFHHSWMYKEAMVGYIQLPPRRQ